MSVSEYHRRRWDEPRVPVRVPIAGSWCAGELEAQRRRDGRWEGWVRCTIECEGEADECSGWFDWGDVQVLDVEDVSQHRQGSHP